MNVEYFNHRWQVDALKPIDFFSIFLNFFKDIKTDEKCKKILNKHPCATIFVFLLYLIIRTFLFVLYYFCFPIHLICETIEEKL